MSPSVQAPGAELAYDERGEGPALLLIHGIAERAEAWGSDPLSRGDSGGPPPARVIVYDRRGYGGSGAPEAYTRTTVEEQAEDAAALLSALNAGPAVVCGRDLGALVCLDLVKRHRGLVRSVVVVDPALYQLVPEATEALGAERVALEQALRDGGPAHAVDAWLLARGAGEVRRAHAREDAQAFFADYGGLATWPVSRRELRSFDAPLSILVSHSAPAYVRAAARALAELVPDATLGDETQLPAALRERLS